MRIVELRLKAFGPFTGTVLTFPERPGLQVLFGLNEAGKSSALRAVRNLFYGIPHRSSDDFLHGYSQMALEGLLERRDGQRLEFARRKGRKNTLLDPRGRPLDEGVLQEFLGGVPEELFITLFGLGHEQLVEGGEEILAGKGSLGESLFAAGLGGPGLRAALTTLQEEADQLYTARGRTRRIHQAVRRYEEARRKVRALTLRGQDWTDLENAFERARQRRDSLRERLIRARTEQGRLERLSRARPLAARHADLSSRLAELGEVPALSDEFPRERDRAQRDLRQAEAAIQRHTEKLRELSQELEALHIPEDLLLEEKAIHELHQCLGARRAAAPERIRQQSLRDEARRRCQDRLREVRPDHPPGRVEELRPTAQQKSRLTLLAQRRGALQARASAAEQRLKELQKKLGGIQRQLQTLPDPVDPAPLEEVVKRARKQAHLEETLRQQRTALETVQEQARVELERLTLWQGSLSELESLPMPTEETVARFEAELRKAENAVAELEAEARQRERKAGELERRLEALRLAGEVPTEEDLSRARRHRQQGWKYVLEAWSEGRGPGEEQAAYAPGEPLSRAYERAVEAADEVADRLRREADRVAEQARLLAEQEGLSRDLSDLEERLEVLRKQREDLEADWRRAWEPAGVKPLPPPEMRAWLAVRGQLLERGEAIRRHRHEIESLERVVSQRKEELARALGCDPGDASLEALLQQAEELLEERKRNLAHRAELDHRLRELQVERAEGQRERDAAHAELEAWRREWGEAVAFLGLEAEAAPEEAHSLLEGLEELFQAVDEAARAEGVLARLEREDRLFTEEAAALCRRVAPELVERSPEECVTLLYQRLQLALQNRTRREQLRVQREEHEEELAQAREAAEDARRRLHDLCRQAGCEDPDRLPDIERRAAEARELREERKRVEERLLELGGGAPLPEYLAEVRAEDPERLALRLEELEAEVEELEAEQENVQTELGRLTERRKAMDGSPAAAEAAAEAQQAAAELREQVHRYLRLRLAHELLRREIERYREEHRGPTMTRASEFFARLTCSAFERLDTRYDEKDEPRLVGIRRGGGEVPVEGMSDGTRDQLFLALRLAILERYLQEAEPLPFIVDDILIRFDGPRAAATLEVLAELARRTQVLYFTHLARDAELARNLGSRARLHELRSTPTA